MIVSSTLSSRNNRYDAESQTLLPISFNHQSGGDVRIDPSTNICKTLQSNQTVAVYNFGGVRRLTPRECERLQGFPDDWTVDNSDTQRYKELGNAVTVNVAEWIGERIIRVHEPAALNES